MASDLIYHHYFSCEFYESVVWISDWSEFQVDGSQTENVRLPNLVHVRWMTAAFVEEDHKIIALTGSGCEHDYH